MTEVSIRLPKAEWKYDTSKMLGEPGGFGSVFLGSGEIGSVAVKKLNLSVGEAAHREMKIGESLAGQQYKHIVPVLDYGEDANEDGYYLVMPVCDYSLQQILQRDGPLSWETAQPIVLQIIAGLLEAENIVHRDLKPGNILFHDGQWKIADFGIAKFVEDATSLQTLRESLTPSYGAPEQWRAERPGHETDVYAVGCIIYTLLHGQPPFVGDLNDVRDGHLFKEAPSLNSGIDRLDAIYKGMLRKPMQSRPTLERVQSVLSSTSTPLSGGKAALASVGKIISDQRSAEESRQAELAAEKKRLEELAKTASSELNGIVDRLFTDIEDVVDGASRTSAKAIRVGDGELRFSGVQSISPPSEANRSYECAAYSTMELIAISPPVGFRGDLGDSSPKMRLTLYFGTTNNDKNFRWREVSFFRAFASGMAMEAIAPTDREFSLAFSNTMSSYQLAYGPIPIDDEDEDGFRDRWLRMFAKAAAGRMPRINALPLPNSFFD